MPLRRIVDQAQDRGRDGPRVLVRHEDTRHPVLDLLQRPVVARGDDREAGGAGFGDDMRHALVARKPDEKIEAPPGGPAHRRGRRERRAARRDRATLRGSEAPSHNRA